MITVYRNKQSENNWYDYTFKNKSNELSILFGQNGDLYFNLKKINKFSTNEFNITKENMFLYTLFAELFTKTQNAEIYKVNELELELCENIEEQQELYRKVQKKNELLKLSDTYKNFYNQDTIIWISDDSANLKQSNILKIKKETEEFKLQFIISDKEHFQTNIRISNSGSRYAPFNILMMELFNKLQEYNPDYHQMHIDEYLYIKQLKKK